MPRPAVSAPTICCSSSPGSAWSRSTTSSASSRACVGNANFTGTHERAPDGFLLAYGGSVEAGRRPRGSIVDVAPTILYFLGPAGRPRHGRLRARRSVHPRDSPKNGRSSSSRATADSTDQVLTRFYRVLLGSTRFYEVLPGSPVPGGSKPAELPNLAEPWRTPENLGEPRSREEPLSALC